MKITPLERFLDVFRLLLHQNRPKRSLNNRIKRINWREISENLWKAFKWFRQVLGKHAFCYRQVITVKDA